MWVAALSGTLRSRHHTKEVLMPIAAVFEFPNEPVEKYEKVFEVGGAAIADQLQRLSHVCYRTGDGFTVVDVWADEASFAAFGEVIGPATQKAGLDAKPQVYPVQGTISQEGARNGAKSPAQETVERFYELVAQYWKEGNPDILDEVLAPDLANSLPGFPPDRDGMKALLPAFRVAIPDLEFTIDRIVAAADLVADAVTWHGTHQAELMGIPASGSPVTVTETHIARVADGKIVERWGTWDQMGLMQQLGAVPAMG